MNWKFLKAISEGQALQIDGVDVWPYEKWEAEKGAVAEVKDPIYKQDFKFTVYRVQSGEYSIRFAAGEFSNGIWGFYVEE